MIRPIVIIGAGGFGRESLDVAEAMIAAGAPLEILGVVDAGPSAENLARLEQRGVRYLGPTWEGLSDVDVVVAIGSPATRRRVVAELTDAGARFATLIHPSATIGSATTIGLGAVICAGVAVSTNVHVGAHVHLNPNATIGHDTVVDDVVSVNPGAIVSGDVVVGSETLIGAGAVVLQGLTIGAGSVVGAAACVVRDVEPQSTVKGVPAR